MPPGAVSVTAVPETSALAALGATVIEDGVPSELTPDAMTVVVPCRLLIGPLRTMFELDATLTVLAPPPLNEMPIGYDALTVFVMVSVSVS